MSERGSRTPDRGFSLVEVIVAFGVFAIVSTAIAGLLFKTVQLSRTNRQRIIASNLMTQQSTLNRQVNVLAATAGTSSRTTVIDSVIYTVTTVLSWVDSGTVTGSCDGTGGQPGTRAFLRATYTTTWPNMTIRPPAQTTLVPVPAGATAPTIGALSVRALDHHGDGQPSIPISVTSTAGGAVITAITDANGCSYFPNLPDGTYQVNTSSTSKVTIRNQTESNATVTVNAGQLPSAYVFYYDFYATMNVTANAYDSSHPLPGGTSKVAPAGLAIGADNGGGGSSNPPAGNASAVLSKPVMLTVFPVIGRTSVYAGSCKDADFGITLNTTDLSTPGRVESDTVKTAAYDVTVKTLNGTGTAVVGATVTAHHTSDATCPTGENYVLPVTTNTSGITKVSLPFGSWSFTSSTAPTAGTASKTVASSPNSPLQTILIGG